MGQVRTGIGVAVAVAGAAMFAIAQLVVTDSVGVLELDGEFVAGNERVGGVPVTLVGWFLATAVPLAVVLAGSVLARLAGAGLTRTGRFAHRSRRRGGGARRVAGGRPSQRRGAA